MAIWGGVISLRPAPLHLGEDFLSPKMTIEDGRSV